jgi:hypothetical protein
MRRKYNPWVSLVALLLAVLILVLTCTGCKQCGGEIVAETEPEIPDRFSVITDENHKGVRICVITDTLTGKEYIVLYTGYAGVTKLEG